MPEVNDSIPSSRRKKLLSFFALSFILIAIPLTVYVTLNSDQASRKQKAATGQVPLLDKQDAVVLSERKVCSMVGQNQTNVGITGEDGGASYSLGGKIFFVFGDTITTHSGMLPNSVSTTTDLNAADCFPLTSKSVNNKAVSMLPKIPGECTVWPLDLTSGNNTDLHFFYYSFKASNCNERLGFGIGKMNPTTLETTRVNNFFWRPNDPETPGFDIYGAAFYRAGDDIYVLWNGQRTDSKEINMLSKVAASSIENKAAYTYWDGNTFQSNPAKMVNLWEQGGVPTHGMTIRYNLFLRKYTLTYNTGYTSVMAMRTASSITGPWSAEMQVVNCLEHYPLSASSAFPCYGAKEHPWYQKNNGQTIYASHSNFAAYQPFVHEIVLGTAIDQSVDASGNAVYKRAGPAIAGFKNEGTAFYASRYSGNNFSAIRDWLGPNGEHQFAVTSPGANFTDQGIVFYAPTTPLHGLAAIFRWDDGTTHRYSALDLSGYGYSKGPLAFYAKITNYRVKDEKTFAQLASNFEIGVKKDGNWVSSTSLGSVTFNGLTSGTKYSVVTNTPFLGNRFFGQNLTADAKGEIKFDGNLGYVNVLNTAVFASNQSLDTTSSLFAYWVKKRGTLQSPSEISHQINPFARADNFHTFLLNGARQSYDATACRPDCGPGGSVVWSGNADFCERDVTITPTGPTKCAKLSGFTITGLAASTDYDLYYCSPNCNDSLVRIIYTKKSDSGGKLILGGSPVIIPPPPPPPPADTRGPAITVKAPVEGAVLKDNVVIEINHTDNVGVTRLETLIDNQPMDVKSAPITDPYKISWVTDKYQNGPRQIKIVASDAAGNITEFVRNVVLNNPTYVYWVHVKGQFETGCCGVGNPSAKTTARTHQFTLKTAPKPVGYEAVVCSPDCGGTVVWTGPVTFSPNQNGGRLTLTPTGPR